MYNSGDFTSTLVFLGATIMLVMWSAHHGNGAISLAAAIASVIFTLYFYTLPLAYELYKTSSKSAPRAACAQTGVSAVQLKTCQYWDGEAAGWCLTWICQLAWTGYACYIAYVNRAVGVKDAVAGYGKWGKAGVAIGGLGYFLYWACSMAVYSDYNLTGGATSGYVFTYDTILFGLGFYHTMGIAASLASMVYWLFYARHMLEDVLILNAFILFYFLSTF
jgi:hypothetical protein